MDWNKRPFGRLFYFLRDQPTSRRPVSAQSSAKRMKERELLPTAGRRGGANAAGGRIVVTFSASAMRAMIAVAGMGWHG